MTALIAFAVAIAPLGVALGKPYAQSCYRR